MKDETTTKRKKKNRKNKHSENSFIELLNCWIVESAGLLATNEKFNFVSVPFEYSHRSLVEFLNLNSQRNEEKKWKRL